MRSVTNGLWPTYQLRVTTPRLRLRLPNDGELAQLAALAGQGVHPPSQSPFLTPWTEGTAQDRARFVLREHWAHLSGWAVDNWRLVLGAFGSNDEPVGVVTLRARDFPVAREVTTSSWLGLRHHRTGLGTEARLGLLTLAFDHLAAEGVVTEVFQDNHASQGVSRDARGSEVLVSERLRLNRSHWEGALHSDVAVDGMEACRHMFEG